MSKTLYVLTIPVTAIPFAKGEREGFLVDFGSTNCFVDEATFHKHFADHAKLLKQDGAQLTQPTPAAVANALPEGLDPALVEGKEPWQVRVIVEAFELGDKVTKLNDFIKSDAFDELPDEQGELLLAQLGAMQEYEKVLNERIGGFE